MVFFIVTVLQWWRLGRLPADQPAAQRGHHSAVPAAAGGGHARHTRQGHRAPRPQATEHPPHTQCGASTHTPSR